MQAFSRILFRALLMVLFIIFTISCTKEDKDPIFIELSDNSVNFCAKGGTIDINITTNGYGTIHGSNEWCTFSIDEFNGNSVLTITVVENTENIDRSTYLVIYVGDEEKEIFVKQTGTGYDVFPDSTGIRSLNCVELSELMGVGWNIGNALDAIGGETNWGNPLISQRLIDSLKSAGFNTIRIPVAWSKFSDASNFIIQESWMNRVEEVVNYVLNNEMYAIINIHWDEGWMQPTYEKQDYVNNRLAIMWNQIATRFRDYDDHLLFAGTNEVMVENDWSAPKYEYYTVQNGFNEVFVNTVRATGGRNYYRHLVIQGFNTNIDYAVKYATIPEDVVNNRLMMEVHYYDPYNFTLNEKSTICQWGALATDQALTDNWGGEEHVDDQFQKMKSNFVSKGVAVILGEFGVIDKRTTDINKYRAYYLRYVTKSALYHGMVPVYWDNGYDGKNGFAIINRTTGDQIYPSLVNAIVDAQ